MVGEKELHVALSLGLHDDANVPPQGVVLEAASQLVHVSLEGVDLLRETLAVATSRSKLRLQGAHRIPCSFKRRKKARTVIGEELGEIVQGLLVQDEGCRHGGHRQVSVTQGVSTERSSLRGKAVAHLRPLLPLSSYLSSNAVEDVNAASERGDVVVDCGLLYLQLELLLLETSDFVVFGEGVDGDLLVVDLLDEDPLAVDADALSLDDGGDVLQGDTC